MPIVELGIADFQSAIKRNGVVLVHFWASWYPPCRRFVPTYEAAALANPDLFFASVDVGTERLLSSALGIHSIPALVAYKAGSAILTAPGACGANHLAEVIQKVRAATQDHPAPARTTTGGNP